MHEAVENAVNQLAAVEKSIQEIENLKMNILKLLIRQKNIKTL